MKKLICIYTDKSEASRTKLDIFKKHEKYISLVKDDSIKVLTVYGNSTHFKIVGNDLFLPCEDKYNELSVKTYEMISRCCENFTFDVLFKIDVSLIGYIDNSKAGFRKEVRQHFYDIDRIFSLVQNDNWIRARKDYGGALLQGRGKPAGHLQWAKDQGINKFDYHLEFGQSESPNIYSGKFYFVSRNLAEYIKDNGKHLALRHKYNLGGVEDILIARLYSQFIKNNNWLTHSLVYKSDHEKFTDFRDGVYDKQPFVKSLFITNDKEKYVWFVVPKAASRSIYELLSLESPLHKHCNSGIIESDQVFLNSPIKNPNRMDYFKFSFVRNPIDRLQSTYADKVIHCKGTEWELPFYRKFFDKSFDYFVDYIHEIKDEKKLERHIRPQIQLLNNLKYIDFIGKIENIDSDIKRLSNILNLNISDFPMLNKSNVAKKNLKSCVRKKIEDIYSEDFNKLNYS